jgi:hypothetical protein
VSFLLNLDIEEFDVRKRPETQEHNHQKLKSLKGFERYWYEVLVTNEFSDEEFCAIRWDEPVFMPTGELLAMYKKFDKQAGRYESVQEGAVSESIRKLCPSAQRKTRRVDTLSAVNKQRRGFDLPSIETARKEFEAYIGCAIPWEHD